MNDIFIKYTLHLQVSSPIFRHEISIDCIKIIETLNLEIIGTFKRRIGGYLALIFNKRPILLWSFHACRRLVEEDIPDFRLNILLKIGRILLSWSAGVEFLPNSSTPKHVRLPRVDIFTGAPQPRLLSKKGSTEMLMSVEGTMGRWVVS